MKKSELIDVVAENTENSKKVTESIISAAFETIGEALEAGDEVRIHKFGIFKISHRTAREGRNPQTGKPLHIPASRSARFVPSKNLKEALKK